MYTLAKLILYAVAIAYPVYEFRFEHTRLVSYEGIGSIVFPAIVLVLQLAPKRKATVKRVIWEFLASAASATVAQFVYLGIQGYLFQSPEMKGMIRVDWTVMPFVLFFLWLLR